MWKANTPSGAACRKIFLPASFDLSILILARRSQSIHEARRAFSGPRKDVIKALKIAHIRAEQGRFELLTHTLESSGCFGG